MDADWAPDARRACAGRRQALQQPRLRPGAGHGRIDRHRQLLRPDAPGRRHGARAAGAGCGQQLARAGQGHHGRARRAAACGVRPAGPLRRVRRRGIAPARADRGAPEGPVRLPPDRPRRRGQEARRAGQDQRHDAVHHRHPRAQHADGGGRASAALRRQGRVLRRHRGDGGQGRGGGEAGAERRGRLCREHLAGDQGARASCASPGTNRPPRSAAASRSSRSTARSRARPAPWRPRTATSTAASPRPTRWSRPSTPSPTWRIRRWSRWTASCASTTRAPRRASAARSRPSTRPSSPACSGSSRSRWRSRPCWPAAASAAAARWAPTSPPSWRRWPRPSARSGPSS